MYLLGITSLLTNIILIFSLGRFIGKTGTIILTFFNIITGIISLTLIVYETIFCSFSCNIKIFSWIFFDYFHVDWGFTYDEVSVLMSIVVLLISTVVHLYSIDYMRSDPFFIRFFLYLTIFTFFMLLFVISDNFLQMFLGWEGVGLTSYLLINFWYNRSEANKAAIKAIIVNRFGDLSIYFALITIFFFFQTFNYSIIFSISYYLSTESILVSVFSENFFIAKLSLISFFILIGAMSKSAQFGFHTWLPDAMEGPTPVSALLHAATMVTAGVYIIIRISPIIEFSHSILWTISLFGGITALFSATIGIFQFDIKKVIAYSTCSQLGYMLTVCGFSGYSIAFFHLFNHAFFKALLFLGAGSIIHSILDEQDMRKMGSLKNYLPITYVSILIASCSLTAVPFLSGFFSKDIILEFVYSDMTNSGLFIFWLGTIAACCTAFYSIRLIYLVFLRQFHGFYQSIRNIHEPAFYTLAIFLFLILLSIFSGFLFSEIYSTLIPTIWSNSLAVSLDFVRFQEFEYIGHHVKLIPLFFSCFFLLLSLFIYRYYHLILRVSSMIFLNNILFSFFYFKWYFDYFYRFFILCFFHFVYYIFYKLIDRGFVEYFGSLSLVRLINNFVEFCSTLTNGIISSYIFFMFLSLFSFWLLVSQFGLLLLFNNLNDYTSIVIYLSVLFLFLFILYLILLQGGRLNFFKQETKIRREEWCNG